MKKEECSLLKTKSEWLDQRRTLGKAVGQKELCWETQGLAAWFELMAVDSRYTFCIN